MKKVCKRTCKEIAKFQFRNESLNVKITNDKKPVSFEHFISCELKTITVCKKKFTNFIEIPKNKHQRSFKLKLSNNTPQSMRSKHVSYTLQVDAVA